MTHSILVRRIDTHPAQAEPLAYDIESLAVATSLAEGIATSYPMHGRNDASGAFWFINRHGLHELLVGWAV